MMKIYEEMSNRMGYSFLFVCRERFKVKAFRTAPSFLMMLSQRSCKGSFFEEMKKRAAEATRSYLFIYLFIY